MLGDVPVATAAAERTSGRPPKVALVPVHWPVHSDLSGGGLDPGSLDRGSLDPGGGGGGLDLGKTRRRRQVDCGRRSATPRTESGRRVENRYIVSTCLLYCATQRP